MLVYKNGRLNREIVPISKDNYILRLSHPTSGMVIETDFIQGMDSDTQKPKTKFKVYKEVDGKYTIYQEFLIKDKTITETFEEAVEFFEDMIFESLKEAPPEESPNKPEEPEKEPEKIKEVPRIGDIVQVGNKYARVLDVNDRNITTSMLSKKEAMRILKDIKNQQISDASAGGQDLSSLADNVLKQLEDGTLEVNSKGMVTSLEDGGSVSGQKMYNVDNDNVLILRVSPPKQAPPEGDFPPPPPPEEIPDNVKDPFEENDDDRDDDDRDDDDRDDDDRDDDDRDDDDRDDDDRDDDDRDDDDRDDDDRDDDDRDDDDRDDDDRDDDDRDDDDRDDDDFFTKKITTEDDIEKIISGINKQLKEGKKPEDLKTLSDIETIKRKLGSNKIAKEFRNKKLTKIALGKEDVFASDNDERLNNALNKIFE